MIKGFIFVIVELQLIELEFWTYLKNNLKVFEMQLN